MSHVFIETSIYSNSTSKPERVPVLYAESGGLLRPVSVVVDYIRQECSGLGKEWTRKFCSAVRLLCDFIEAHPGYLDKPAKIYREFHRSIQYGTIDETGTDTSRLFWLARSANNAKNILSMLDRLLDWVAKKKDYVHLNPFQEASSYEKQLNWMAYLNRTDKALLGHLSSKKGAYEIAAVRLLAGLTLSD
jgi:hypothetical protein